MTHRTYVFYDTETTGTSPRHDHPLQLAAIRTDAGFREVDAIDLRSKRPHHVVPGPKALEVTGVDPWSIDDEPAMSPHAFAKTVHETFRDWSPACFMGYNIIRFDEEILRQLFWENLLFPFLTNVKGSFRADLLTILEAWHAVRPDAVVFPERNDGGTSLRLENVAPANGFADMNAHDAQGDNRAAAYMARLLKDDDPDLWEQLVALGQPRQCEEILARPLVRFLTHFGVPETHLTTPVASNPSNPKEWILFDLSVDPSPYLDLTAMQLRERIGEDFRVLRSVKTNRHPVLMDDDDVRAPSPTNIDDRALAEERSRLLREHPHFKVRLAEALGQRSREFDSGDRKELEDRIYDGFESNADRKRKDRFHELDDWGERLRLVNSFEDERLRGLGKRIVAAEAPEALHPDLLSSLRSAIASRRLLAEADSAPWTTIADARAQLDEIGDPAFRARVAAWLDALEASAMTDAGLAGEEDALSGGNSAA